MDICVAGRGRETKQYIIRAMVTAERARSSRIKRGAAFVLLVLVLVGLWFRGGIFGRQYEYEEALRLSVDGSATLTLNASLAALAALRGLDLDPLDPAVDRETVRAAYESPVATVTSVPRPWTRRGRPFVQVNLRIPDIRRLHEADPFAWSRYELFEQDGHLLFRQTVGRSRFRPGTLPQVGWDGREIVGFRLHLPSRVLEHNARDLETDEPSAVARGNILAWEQHLSDRLDGQPLLITVRMESQSILYLTLWLFAGAFTAAVLTLVALVWWLFRRGRDDPGPAPHARPGGAQP